MPDLGCAALDRLAGATAPTRASSAFTTPIIRKSKSTMNKSEEHGSRNAKQVNRPLTSTDSKGYEGVTHWHSLRMGLPLARCQ